MRRTPHLVLAVSLTAITLVPSQRSIAADPPGVPTYDVAAFITGSIGPVDANNTGIVVGAQTVPNTLNRTPWISVGGGAWTALPAPTESTSTYPVAVNDFGVVAGNSVVAGQPRAIRWLPSPTGYTVELLPWLSVYGRGSAATGINNAGQIVGARAGLFSVVDAYGWVYSDTGGLIDLFAVTGRDLIPVDINNAGILLSSGTTYDLATGSFTPTPPVPPGYQGVGGASINDVGQLSGWGPSTSQSLPSQAAFRGVVGGSWQLLGTAGFVGAGDINVLGDVAYYVQPWSGAAVSAIVDLAGFGSFSPNALLTPAAGDAGWLVTGSMAQLTDTRSIVVYGRNTTTGQAGTLVLTPSGQSIPVPAAPTSLTATPHPATAAEQWVSIDLAWVGSDPYTLRYEVQRARSGSGSYTTIAQPNSLAMSDTTVALNTTYDYRVRAVGSSGASAWSPVATATSPAQPLDVTSPTVTLSGPADGSAVSGVVTLTAAASDNVGVTQLSVSVTNSNTGYAVQLGSTPSGGPLTVQWNTAGLPAGTYGVQAVASDAIGNLSSALLWLLVGAPTQTAKVAAIDLRASARGNVVTVTGVVTVTTLAGAAIPGASVTVIWQRPNGTQQTLSATTTSRGRATFSTTGGRGTYTLTVTNLSKPGFTFDPIAGPQSGSITK